MNKNTFFRRDYLIGLALAIFGLSSTAQAVVYQAENPSAFFDTTNGNLDTEATTDTGGGLNVGWIEATEWMAYNGLSIPSTGSYIIRMRVASPSGATASVDLNAGAIQFGNFAIPATGGWQNWTTVSKTVNINAGTYNLGVFAQTAGWNFNWIEVVPANTNPVTRATVFQHCNYTGWSVGLDVGNYNLAALQSRGFVDNDASSIQVSSGYEVVLYQNDNFTGTSRVVTATDDCFVNEGFNDNVTSLIVRPTSGRRLVWSDEFDSINTSNWTFETGGGGWGNNELQYYTNGQNAAIQNDAAAGSNVLVITARRENPAGYGCWYGSCTYTSSRMITRDKRSFQYGRIEARMKLPQTQGIWPAFWMLGNNLGSVGWPNSGEIDIMEHVGFEPTVTHGAIHGPGYSGATPFMGTHYLPHSADAAYHVYAVEWNANEIAWFVDGTRFYSVSKATVQTRGNWVFDQPFWLLLNIAVGGTWPGSPDGGSVFPQRLYVDYVRVYQ